MEILAGEAACYRLLAFISLGLGLHWRANAVGKGKPNLPFYRNLKNTQKPLDSAEKVELG
jgi:putative transposase